MHAKMALFRNFSRLQKFQQLYELYATRGDTISLLPLENVAKRHVIKSPWRGIVTVPNKYQLSSLSNSVTCTPPYFASYRGFHTPSSSLLSSREGKNQQKVTKNPRKSDEHGSVLNELMSVKQEAQPTQLTVGAKVVQAGRDFTYILVVLGGFAVAGFLLWSVGSEFFSSNSPQTIYAKALKRVKLDQQVKEVLGEPISGHGELSGRGRRREPLHQEYEVEGVTYMRMKFYVKGSRRTGTVHLDMKKNEQGRYGVRFLFMELDGHPKRTVIIEDNR